jgi:F-type H+-transporting ATPase subunit delta
MKISKQNRRDAKALFQSSVVNGVLDENRARQIVTEVLALQPRGYLNILEHYKRLVKLDQERHSARIESATPLTPESQDNFKAVLERKYGRGLHFSFTENPALIGGVRVQVGSDVYDSSIRTRLNDLKEAF